MTLKKLVMDAVVKCGVDPLITNEEDVYSKLNMQARISR